MGGAQAGGAGTGEVAPVFCESRCEFHHGNYRADDFSKFPSGGANSIGKSSSGGGGRQGRCELGFNFNPCERSDENYGVDESEDYDCGGRSGCIGCGNRWRLFDSCSQHASKAAWKDEFAGRRADSGSEFWTKPWNYISAGRKPLVLG